MTLLNQTKLLVASAAILAILSCSIDGFTPLLSLRPHLQTAFTTSTELDAKKKKKVQSGQGFGAGVAQLDKPKTISEMTKIELKDECRNRGLKVGGNKAVLIERLLNAKVVKEEVAPEAISPIAPEELEKFGVPDGDELFQRSLLAQKLKYDTNSDLAELKKSAEIFQRSLLAQQLKNAVAEPEPEAIVVVADVNELFQRSLLAQKVKYDTNADLAELKKSAEIFQRSLLAQQLKNAVAEPEPEAIVVVADVHELFQRSLLAQKFKYDTNADLAKLKKAAEIFQRSLLAQQLKNGAKAAVAEPESGLGQRIQPLNADHETSVASKYAAIADVGERAFEILSDLGFFNRKD